MDQSAVNKIIMDSTVAETGCRCNELEKELQLLKGSIKKLIIDIREKMNDTDNPFRSIEALEGLVTETVPQKAADPELDSEATAAAKPDGTEAVLPGKEEKKVAETTTANAKKEDDMTQAKSHYEATGCPFVTRANTARDHCPLVVTSHSLDKQCAVVRGDRTSGQSCPQARTGRYAWTGGSCEGRICPADGREWRMEHPSVTDSHNLSSERSFCTVCGRPADPGDNYCAYSPEAYRPYSCRNSGRSDPGQPYGSRPAAGHRQGYQPAYPSYGREYQDPYQYSGYEPRREAYPPQARRRQSRASPGPLPGYEDRYDDEQYDAEYRQPYYRVLLPEYYPQRPRARKARSIQEEPEYEYYESPVERWQSYGPAPGPRQRVRRAPAYPEPAGEPYYEPDSEVAEESWYEPVPQRKAQPQRRRKVQYMQPPDEGVYSEYEVTEPRPEIADALPESRSEPEYELPRARRKSSRRMISDEELPEPEVMDLPNPRPRRSRSAKPRG